MTVLPVVERELRVAARRRGTYWGRFVAAVIGAGLAAWVLLAIEDTDVKIGADLFYVVSTVIFVYATVAGTLVTCDCLSEEKREGTLGLLFLTDLKGYDVVIGKLVATSVNAFYGMLAVLPMLAIPFILGGVTQAEMLRVVAVSINLLFFFLSIGLFVSALCRRDNWALGLSIMIGLVAVVAGPVASTFRNFPFPAAAVNSSPAAGCFFAFDDIYKDNPAYFWWNLGTTHVYGWIFFVLACWIVPRSWQDRAVGEKTVWKRAAAPEPSARGRAVLLNVNPFLWRVARTGRKRLLVWGVLGVLALLWKWCYHWFNSSIWEPGVDFLLLVPAGFVLKVWLTAEASRTLSQDHWSGGLELLLSTPLRESEIVRGQLLALWRQFALPVGSLLLANLMFVVVEIRRWEPGDERSILLALHLILGVFLAVDMIALAWIGMWLGLINRKPNRAALLALARILILPSVAFVVLFALWALVQNNNSQAATPFTFWILLGLAADLYFGLGAAGKMRDEFRTTVAEGLARKRVAEPVAKPAPVLVEAQ